MVLVKINEFSRWSCWNPRVLWWPYKFLVQLQWEFVICKILSLLAKLSFAKIVLLHFSSSTRSFSSLMLGKMVSSDHDVTMTSTSLRIKLLWGSATSPRRAGLVSPERNILIQISKTINLFNFLESASLNKQVPLGCQSTAFLEAVYISPPSPVGTEIYHLALAPYSACAWKLP